MNPRTNQGGPAAWVRILRGGFLAALSPDGRAGHRVRPWPDLTPERWDERQGRWRVHAASADCLFRAFTAEGERPAGACTLVRDWAVPRFASVPGGWCERPDGQQLLPFWVELPAGTEEFAAARAWEMLEAFRATLPPEIRTLIAEFPVPPFKLLRLLARVPALLALAHENFAVAWHLTALEMDDPTLAGLVRARRRDRMRTLGLPPAAYGFLARVPPDGLRPAQVRDLAEAAVQPVFGKCLQHLNPVPAVVVELVRERAHWDLLTPSLIHQVARCCRQPGSLAAFEASFLVTSLAGLPTSPGAARPRKRLRALRELTAALAGVPADSSRSPAPSAEDPTPLPAPPVPGTASLVPLRTVGEAVREGRAQANCVGGEEILAEVRAGRQALFRTQSPAPARLTVLVECQPEDGGWVVRDVRGPGDEPPGFGTLQWVAGQLGLPVDPFWLPRDAVFLPVGAPRAILAPVVAPTA
jgi:hypothetical protein